MKKNICGVMIIIAILTTGSSCVQGQQNHPLATTPNRDIDQLRQAWFDYDLEALLTNAIVYEVSGIQHEQGWWSLHGSHFGYAEDVTSQAPGLDRVCEVVWRNRTIYDMPYLTIRDSETGQQVFPSPSVIRQATYRPYLIEETLMNDGVRADTLIVYEDTSRLWAEVRVSTTQARHLDIEVNAPTLAPAHGDRYLIYHNSPFNLLVGVPESAQNLLIEPGQTEHFPFTVTTITIPTDEDTDYTPLLTRTQPMEQIIASQRAQIFDRLRRLPAPGPDPLRAQLYYRAFLTLENIRWAPHPNADGPFGDRDASLPQKPVYSGHWLWDGSFQALGYVFEDRERAYDQLRILFDYQDQETGSVPNFIDLEGNVYGDRSQPPVIAWVAWEIYKQTKDVEFLREVYPHLSAYANWWGAYRDTDQDGLSGYGDSDPPLGRWTAQFESGWDTSPRWDEGCSDKEALDLNSWRVAQHRALALMARELGEFAAAEVWQASAEHLTNLVNEHLYDPEDGCYYDAHRDLGTLNRVLTPASFFPLFAGIPDNDQARRLVDTYLLDTERMWPSLPSVAYDHHTYTPRDYWRGPTWINLAYMTIHGLERYGFRDEADALTQYVLDVAFQDNHLGEYYDSQTGESIGKLGYGWTAAFVMRLILAL